MSTHESRTNVGSTLRFRHPEEENHCPADPPSFTLRTEHVETVSLFPAKQKTITKNGNIGTAANLRQRAGGRKMGQCSEKADKDAAKQGSQDAPRNECTLKRLNRARVLHLGGDPETYRESRVATQSSPRDRVLRVPLVTERATGPGTPRQCANGAKETPKGATFARLTELARFRDAPALSDTKTSVT